VSYDVDFARVGQRLDQAVGPEEVALVLYSIVATIAEQSGDAQLVRFAEDARLRIVGRLPRPTESVRWRDDRLVRAYRSRIAFRLNQWVEDTLRSRGVDAPVSSRLIGFEEFIDSLCDAVANAVERT
jgi:hypothetical protein